VDASAVVLTRAAAPPPELLDDVYQNAFPNEVTRPTKLPGAAPEIIELYFERQVAPPQLPPGMIDCTRTEAPEGRIVVCDRLYTVPFANFRTTATTLEEIAPSFVTVRPDEGEL
jgi:hypothetical protein